jgi:hypothetical protein
MTRLLVDMNLSTEWIPLLRATLQLTYWGQSRKAPALEDYRNTVTMVVKLAVH